VFDHLSQGTRPSKKNTKIKDVKKYLQVVSLSRDGVLIVKHTVPFVHMKHLIVVPRSVLPGLLTALHLQLDHPVKSQLVKVFHRYFYALDADNNIQSVTSACSQCAALARLPQEVVEYSSSPPPTGPGSMFACDVLRRAKQKIFLVRDTFSSFTKAKLIPDESKNTLRDALIELTADLKASTGAVVRADGATAMQSLISDTVLARHGISIEVGRLKNINKNPIAEKCIQELENEMLRKHPTASPISPPQLAVVVNILNSRIRHRGLSAKEILFQRDNETLTQLNFSDKHLAKQQHEKRLQNHLPSALSKAPKGIPAGKAMVKPGDLVYVKVDGSKHSARDRYIVSSCTPDFVHIQKLIGSQFRSKEYKVKRTEIYPVPYHGPPPLTAHQDSHLDVSSSSDDDADQGDKSAIIQPHALTDMSDFSEDESYQSDNHSTHSQSVHSGYNSREDLSDIDNTSNNSGGDAVDSQNTAVPVKSTCQHRQPSWMRSDDWEM
jgi:hypothetical protein